MAINPIALQAKAADTSGALNTLAAVRQIQAANQQRQMNQLAMEDAQRKRSSEEAFKNALMTGDYKTPAGMNRLMGIDPTSALALQKNLLDQETARKSALKSDLELFSKAAGGMPDTAENYSFLYKGAVGDNPALASFLPDPSQYKTGLMTQFAVGAETLFKRATTESANQARLDAANIRAAATRAAAERAAERPFDVDGNLVSPSGKIIYQKTQTPEKAPTSVEEYNFYADQEKREGRPVKSYEQWVNSKNAPAAKQLTPYQQQKIKDNVATDYENLSKVFDDVEGIVAGIEDVRNSPGLEAETGYGSYLYSFPESEAAKAQTRLDRLKGKITSIGKSVAAMSGAIGSMAVAEWKILRDQVGALDTAIKKGKTVTEEELSSIESFAMGFKNRAADAYTKQYGEYFEQFPQYQELPSFDPGKRQEVKRKAATNSNAVDTSNPLLGD